MGCGSTPIAQYIYDQGTKYGKRVQALGGAKNHMIVLPDADMDLAAAAALLASSVALAAPAQFKKADANGDGSVDATEYAASGAKKEMAKLDKDGDGKLSKKEYSALFDEDCE